MIPYIIINNYVLIMTLVCESNKGRLIPKHVNIITMNIVAAQVGAVISGRAACAELSVFFANGVAHRGVQDHLAWGAWRWEDKLLLSIAG